MADVRRASNAKMTSTHTDHEMIVGDVSEMIGLLVAVAVDLAKIAASHMWAPALRRRQKTSGLRTAHDLAPGEIDELANARPQHVVVVIAQGREVLITLTDMSRVLVLVLVLLHLGNAMTAVIASAMIVGPVSAKTVVLASARTVAIVPEDIGLETTIAGMVVGTVEEIVAGIGQVVVRSPTVINLELLLPQLQMKKPEIETASQERGVAVEVERVVEMMGAGGDVYQGAEVVADAAEQWKAQRSHSRGVLLGRFFDSSQLRIFDRGQMAGIAQR